MARPKKYLDKSVLKAEYIALHAEAEALWSGLPKQTAKTIKNAALVKSMRASSPRAKAPTTAAAHGRVKARREALRGVVAGLKIATPADRKEMRRWILILWRTPSVTPLADRIEEMAKNIVVDNRIEDRPDPSEARDRHEERLRVFASVLMDFRDLAKTARRYRVRNEMDTTDLDALILAVDRWLPEHPAATARN